jgi:serine/threonine protein kinase
MEEALPTKIPELEFHELQKYKPVRKLGHGCFGEVWLVQHNETGDFFALKIISKSTSNDPFNELKIAGILGESPYVVKTYAFSQNQENLYIIMEYVSGAKDLCDFVSMNPGYFQSNPSSFWKVAFGILMGIHYMHQNGVAHGDIKPENVMVDLDMNAKLIDFGLSLPFAHLLCNTMGTMNYMAPEMAKGTPRDEKIDIWSFGILLYTILTCSFPSALSSTRNCPEAKKQSILRKLQNLQLDTQFNPFQQMAMNSELLKIQQFILRCFIVNPENRPRAQDLLNVLIQNIQ